MINGLQLSFFSNYIHAPKIWLHSLSARQKIFIMSIYLISIPSIPISIFIGITIIILFIFISLANNHDSYYVYTILLGLFVYCLLLLLINHISSISPNDIIIIIPYQFTIQLIKHNLHTIYKIQFQNIIKIFISRLIIRSILILFSYYLLYQLIIFTTQIEELLIHNLYIIYHVTKNIPISFISEIIFIMILTYEYITLLEINIQNMITSLTIRGQYLNLYENYYEFLQICFLGFEMLKNQATHEIFITNNIIYTRELNMSKKNKWLIT